MIISSICKPLSFWECQKYLACDPEAPRPVLLTLSYRNTSLVKYSPIHEVHVQEMEKQDPALDQWYFCFPSLVSRSVLVSALLSSTLLLVIHMCCSIVSCQFLLFFFFSALKFPRHTLLFGYNSHGHSSNTLLCCTKSYHPKTQHFLKTPSRPERLLWLTH